MISLGFRSPELAFRNWGFSAGIRTKRLNIDGWRFVVSGSCGDHAPEQRIRIAMNITLANGQGARNLRWLNKSFLLFSRPNVRYPRFPGFE